MVNYYVKRIGQTVIVYFLAITVAFVLYRMLPFGPVEVLQGLMIDRMGQSGEQLSTKQMKRINELVEVYTNINPDQPLWKAYLDYVSDIVLHLDFGKSIYQREPVFQILFSRMPWSLFISIYGLALGTTTSLLLGALMAYTEGTRFDKGLTVFTIFNTSIPYYFVAIFSIIIFGFWLDVLPWGGRYDQNLTPGFNLPFMVSVVKHGTLPIMSSFIAGFGGGLAYRGNCVREMGKDYVRVGRLRGLSQSRLAIRYVGRNSLLPIYTGLMMGIAGVFSSSVILETIFNYPAVGYVTFQALRHRDYPLIMGAFLFFTAMTLIGILIADLTYGIIDPRVKGGGERETF